MEQEANFRGGGSEYKVKSKMQKDKNKSKVAFFVWKILCLFVSVMFKWEDVVSCGSINLCFFDWSEAAVQSEPTATTTAGDDACIVLPRQVL